MAAQRTVAVRKVYSSGVTYPGTRSEVLPFAHTHSALGGNAP